MVLANVTTRLYQSEMSVILEQNIMTWKSPMTLK